FTVADLLRRATNYGVADWHLFQKHPELLAAGESVFGKLTTEDFERLEALLSKNSLAATDGIAALEALDKIDFVPIFAQGKENPISFEGILKNLPKFPPLFYWHVLLKTFLSERARFSAPPDLFFSPCRAETWRP